MFVVRWAFFTVACICSALAQEGLKPRANVSYSMSMLKEELQKEVSEDFLRTHAEKDAKNLARKIRNHIAKIYFKAIASWSTHEEAVSHIMPIIEKDIINNVNSELQDTVRSISYEALDDARTGLLKRSEAIEPAPKKEKDIDVSGVDPLDPGALLSSEKRVYISIDELLSSLSSHGPSTRWTSTSNMSLEGAKSVRYTQKTGFQVMAEFAGITIEAGPVIKGTQEYSTRAVFMAEDLKPVLAPDGGFEFYDRDRSGNITRVNGAKVRRHIAFICEVEQMFDSELEIAGSLKLFGIGHDRTVTSRFSQVVKLVSRRIQLPEFVGGKSVNPSMINSICHDQFLHAKVTAKLTVKDSLDMMMKNYMANVVYSNSKTKCIVDSHCVNWFNKEVLFFVKDKNYPRCEFIASDVEGKKREDYLACNLKGLKYQNCSVYDNAGKLISSGKWEFDCDKGLKCVTIEQPGFMKAAVGRCMPIDAKSYRSPLTTAVPVQVIQK